MSTNTTNFINNTEATNTKGFGLYFESLYTFKVFRMTTRFRKYNRGPLTLTVREKHRRRKRRTNFIPLSYVLKH